MQNYRHIIKRVKRVVIKIGSGVLTNENGLSESFFSGLGSEVAKLHKKGIEVVIVSSGAIACGMNYLKLKRRPEALPKKQAVAAIGQPQLMNLYSRVFNRYKMTTAQMLLTRSDLENRDRSLNARHAVNELLREKVIPIINENDSVVVEEIKVGDNDQLSAMVAYLAEAQLLVILTDINGLFDKDPKRHQNAQRIPIVKKVADSHFGLAKDTSSQKSTGGMVTKLKAVAYARKQGIPTWIVNGKKPSILSEVFLGNDVGTLFLT